MSLPTVILASASPRRSELLRGMGVTFLLHPSRATELAPDHLSPAETAQINAHRKARAVAKQFPDALVLGADTVVSLGVEQLAKPADLAEAERMLMRLQGRTHLVVTGVCLLRLRPWREELFAVATAVTFRRLHRRAIQRYLRRIRPLDKAGGYAIQEEGDQVVRSIRGSYSNVVGLPVERLRQALERWSAPA